MDNRIERHALTIFDISRGTFTGHLEALRRAKIVQKPTITMFIFPNWTTVIGNTVYLAKPFFTWEYLDQCQNLCHEAVHLMDWASMGYPQFSAKYATPSGRIALEKRAYVASIHFWMLAGRIRKTSSVDELRSNPLCRNIIHKLMTAYYAHPNEYELWQWMTKTVSEFNRGG